MDAYEYSIKHKAGKDLANADALRRLPLYHYPENVPVPGDNHWVMQHLDTTPVTAADIKIWINKGPLLSKVERFDLMGWQVYETGEDTLCPWKDELTVHNGWES